MEEQSSHSADEDSDEPPDRWQQSNSLEMDCVFLDEDTANENNLPDVFDVQQVQFLQSQYCMFCSKHFGSSVFSAVVSHHCSRCGKSVCDSCSQARHRLSKLEKKKYRVCDACEMILLNYKLA